MLSIDMQFMLDEEKQSILDMAPKWRDIMADMVIAKCMRNRWLNAFFPIDRDRVWCTYPIVSSMKSSLTVI